MADGMLQHLGRACRAARLSTGILQIDVAVRAGVDRSTISRFENGKYWPTDPDLMVAAYVAETGVSDRELWAAALELWVP